MTDCVSCCRLQTAQQPSPVVVALGSGTQTFGGPPEHLSGGRVLTDCHAEVIARRGLQSYLYGQAELAALGGGGARGSIFELVELHDGWGLRLRPGTQFHLYISAPPCGDATVMSPGDRYFGLSAQMENAVDLCCRHWPTNAPLLRPGDARRRHGLLRYRAPSVQGSLTEKLFPLGIHKDGDGDLGRPRGGGPGIPKDDDADAGTAACLRKMSCSDKLAMWNSVGLQGALLSRVLEEPVYLCSITIGCGPSKFSHGAMARAVCCRLALQDPPLGEGSEQEGRGLKLEVSFGMGLFIHCPFYVLMCRNEAMFPTLRRCKMSGNRPSCSN